MADLTTQVTSLDLSASHDPPASSESAAPSTTILFPPHNATVIDKDGDLFLVVGAEKRAFQVDSRALVRVSRVWRAMLTGGWSESRPASGAWIVDLPSDSPGAMEILLHIIHLNTRQIPRAADIGFDQLFHVVNAVDVYDLGGCLDPWGKKWCRATFSAVFTTSYVPDLARMAWVAWVFGDSVSFQCVLNRLVMEVEVDEDGKLTDHGDLELGQRDFIQAMDILEQVAATRTRLIGSLLDIIGSTIKGAVTSPKTANPSPFCRSTTLSALRPDSARYKARADCTNAILGSLFQSLSAERLFPFPSDPGEILESVSMLKQRLIRVVQGIETLGVLGGAGTASIGEEAHAGCNPKEKLVKLLNDAVDRPTCWLSEAHTTHFDKMAERL